MRGAMTRRTSVMDETTWLREGEMRSTWPIVGACNKAHLLALSGKNYQSCEQESNEGERSNGR